jgi:cation:H+ antiporter
MLIAAAAILIGIVILIWSADLFVAGAASIADNLGMSPVLIGLTIVSLGTSAPEVVVALIASLADAGELAIGNAIGSNIANIGLVLGVTLMISPLFVHKSCMQREMPTLLVVTVAVGVLVIDREASRLDGILMMGALALILVQLVRTQSHDLDAIEELSEEPLPNLSPLKAWLAFFCGLVLLIGSSRLLVWSASEIAIQLGVSKLVIGLTVVAVGTSLPELAATIASAVKGHTEIALGNVIGSNLFNLLGVMSIPAIITPQMMEPAVLFRDYLGMTAITILLALGMVVGRQRRLASSHNSYLGRSMGALLLFLYALYYYWLYLTL